MYARQAYMSMALVAIKFVPTSCSLCRNFVSAESRSVYNKTTTKVNWLILPAADPPLPQRGSDHP